MRRSVIGLAAVALMLTLGSVTAISAPAAANPAESRAVATDDVTISACSYPSWGNWDSDYGELKDEYESVYLYAGPYSACETVATIWRNDILYYHCYVVNSYGNTWTHVRIKGFQIYGWVWDGYLKDNGSNVPC